MTASTKPFPQKLHFRAGMRVLMVHAPADLLLAFPEDLACVSAGEADAALLFVC